jgi:hypothetical protein
MKSELPIENKIYNVVRAIKITIKLVYFKANKLLLPDNDDTN